MAPELLYHHTSIRLLHRANLLTLICGDRHRYALDALGCTFPSSSVESRLLLALLMSYLSRWCLLMVYLTQLYMLMVVSMHIQESLLWVLVIGPYFVNFTIFIHIFFPYLSKVFTTPLNVTWSECPRFKFVPFWPVFLYLYNDSNFFLLCCILLGLLLNLVFTLTKEIENCAKCCRAYKTYF